MAKVPAAPAREPEMREFAEEGIGIVRLKGRGVVDGVERVERRADEVRYVVNWIAP